MGLLPIVLEAGEVDQLLRLKFALRQKGLNIIIDLEN